MTSTPRQRIFFIDNIRIFLISLIVLLHLAITYGAPGGWYYREVKFEELDTLSFLMYVLFNATIQAFSLGFFFMISGYFTRASIERKSAGRFIKDRCIRLGIPLVLYCVAINPFVVFLVWGNGRQYRTFLVDYVKHTRSLGVGPLWFVETLLIFSCCYLIWRFMKKPAVVQKSVAYTPGNKIVALYALIIGLLSFTVRIWLPVGWNFELMNLQFPFFPQYIGMFTLGIVAYRENWFERISNEQGRFWLIVSMALIVTWPIFLVVVKASGGIESAVGGLHWQSLYYAVWEQFVCVGMVIGLSVFFRRKYNRQGSFAQALSGAAYSVFIFHAPIIVILCLAVKDVQVYPLVKFMAMAPVALTVCFAVSYCIKKIPGAGKIL